MTNAGLRVADLPPPLVARDDQVRGASLWRVRDAHGPDGQRKDPHQHEERHHRPHNLQPPGAEYLARLARARARPRPDQAVGDQPGDNRQDDRADDQDTEKQIGNRLPLRRGWTKD